MNASRQDLMRLRSAALEDVEALKYRLANAEHSINLLLRETIRLRGIIEPLGVRSKEATDAK